MAHCTGKRKKASTKVRSYSMTKKKSPIKGHKCNCTTPSACKRAGRCLKHGGKRNARKKKK